MVSAWSSSEAENVITNIMLLRPREICTGTWSVLEHFETEQEALNFIKYIKTKFARGLIKAGYPSYKMPGQFYFRFCPLQVFTNHSDIDWSLSVKEINTYLYKKYYLTEAEQNYIEDTIKEM